MDSRRLLPLFILMLLVFTPVHAQTFGRLDAGTLASGPLRADFKRASKFTLTEQGVLLNVCAYVDGQGGIPTGTQQIRFVVYGDQNGVPGAKIAESELQDVGAGSIAYWQGAAVSSATPIPAGTCWLALHSGDTAGIIRYYYDGPANWYGNSDAFADGASNPFGVGATGEGTLSIYAIYTFPHAPNRNAGRTTVGSMPSQGMTANFKRGSSFTLDDTGFLYTFGVYLDGKGASTGTQSIRAVLYSDANGVPGEKLAESEELRISAGDPAAWHTIPAPRAPVYPGRYWIVLHTGGDAGVIRDFADGSGNWYGNSDAYADGASQTFGPGAPGNGTLSAYITYEPGTLVTKTFGRTDIARTPSRGLGANFARGSTFGLFYDEEDVATALYAYLDGNGGASGSQQVRMSIYSADHAVYELLATSDPVTIAAGTPPGWVRFPIPPTPVSGFSFIAIESGGTGGVVRDYGDGSANWLGGPDTFADGPLEIVDNRFLPEGWGTGNVTLSVYAEYLERH